MENDLYARDVEALLSRTPLGRGYKVVGFLTTTGTIWKSLTSTPNSTGIDMTVPTAEFGGITVAGLGDPGVSPSISRTIG